MTEHKLTVFVTIYNISEYLSRFFDCMSKQSYQDYLLLLFDDGSTDDSLAICQEYAQKDERIRIIESEHIGISAARNYIISHISTPFIVSADGDDVYEKDYLLHLVEAKKKYQADLVISRVCYRNEAYEKIGAFVQRGEICIERENLKDWLPMLLDDRRLNYLYGKLYRKEVLSDLRVEDDVKQGSDTMLNCQYIKKVNRIVLIDDLDTNYIKYSSRSVTAYNGEDAFQRLCRINQYIFDCFISTELMSDQLMKTIDGRILQSAIWVLDQIAVSKSTKQDKYRKASEIVTNKLYREAFQRELEAGRLKCFTFPVFVTGEEREYIDRVIKTNRTEKTYLFLHKIVPGFVFKLYYSLKKRI